MIFINMEKYTKSDFDRVSKLILSEQAIPMKDLMSQEKAKAKKASLKGSNTIAQTMAADVNASMDAKKIGKFFSDHRHEVMGALEIAALLIPVPGVNVAISTAIAGADAAMYWNEGDKYTAGFVATLSAIPLIGTLALKIPGVKQLGAKGIIMLAKKMKLIKAGKKPALTAAEQTVIKQLGKHQKLVTTETSKYYAKKVAAKQAGKQAVVKKAGKVAKGVASSAANYVASRAVWNSVYTSSGIQQSEIAALIEPSLKRLFQSKKLKTAEGKLSIETIIREEIQAIKEQLTITKPTATKPTKPTKPTTTKTTATPPPAAKTTASKPTATTKDSTNTGQYTSDDAFKKLIDNSSSSGKVTIGVLAILGGLAVYKGYRFAKFKINLVRNSLKIFNKNPSDFIKLWQSGKLEQELMSANSFKKLSKKEQDRLLSLLRNPKAMTNTVALSVDDMAAQFMAGKISAADLKAVLPADSLARYENIIDKIERDRTLQVNIPKGITTAAEKPVAKPAPRISYTMTPKK